MKMKMAAALDTVVALKGLANVKVPVGLSLKLRALSREVDTLTTDYEAERVKLLKEHAETDDAGELVTNDDQTVRFTSSDAAAAFYAALVELREQEVDIKTSIQPGNFGTAEVEPAIVLALGDILTDA